MRTGKILKSSLRKTQRAAGTLRRRAQVRACFRAGRTRPRSFSSPAAAAAKPVSNRKVSDKLEALKNLIPGGGHFKNRDEEEDDDETVKAEQLFQETADYIILLRTRVVVLQRLIEFYGSATTTSYMENQNDNHANVLL